MSEKEYVVIVKADVDLEAFDAEVAADTGSGQIPNRAVTVANPRIGSKRMTHWMLTDEEAETLAQDERVVAVEIPPSQRTDMEIGFHASQTSTFQRESGNDSTWVNWGLRRCIEEKNDDIFNDATTLTGDYLYALDGTGVDFIVQDSGIQADHPEFAITIDPEYNNSALSDVVGDGSDFFKREVTVNGVRIMAAGAVGGQTAVPDAFVEKVARMFELFTDPTGTGINETAQRALIKNLSGDTGTYHVGKPTIQRVARGAGADYSTNFLTDAGIIFWNLTDLFDATVQNDMVWYLNSTGGAPGDGDQDAQEVIEHVFHTIHMHGLDAQTLKLYPFLSSDWNTGPLYNAMVEAYDGGFWDSSGYGGNAWKTDGDAFEVAAKEYLYLLNFCMFDYSSLWDGGSLSPEWSDSMRTPAGIQSNNPLGYALHNSYIAPVISKPTLATIRNIFQDGDTGDPTVAGASGYVTTDGSRVQQIDWFAGSGIVGETQDSNFYTDYDGHGTHCAGIAAGKTFGWAKNARVYAQKLGGLEGTADPNNGISITNAFDCIRIWHNNKSGANAGRPTVVNMSWGYGTTRTGDPTSGTYRGTAWTYGVDYTTRSELEQYTGVNQNRTTSGGVSACRLSVRNATVDAEIEDMVAAGIHVVIAAGNNFNKIEASGGTDYDNEVVWSGVTTTYHRGSSPYSSNAYMVASLDSTTQSSVVPGGINVRDRTSIFSSRGPGCNIWAPGSDIMSACCTPYNTGKYSPIAYFGDSNFYQMSISGTSMAAPQVAGLLCLHLESNPTLTPAQLKSKILADAKSVVYSTGQNADYNQISTSTFGQDLKIIYSRYASANAFSITKE